MKLALRPLIRPRHRSHMSAGKFRHMPVVDQGRLVGMVSIGDVVKHRLHAMERDSAAMRDYIVTA
jgi:CBS domain-containing protein